MELESVGGSSSIDVYVAVLFVSEKLIVFYWLGLYSHAEVIWVAQGQAHM